jgi:hypothetical protein
MFHSRENSKNDAWTMHEMLDRAGIKHETDDLDNCINLWVGDDGVKGYEGFVTTLFFNDDGSLKNVKIVEN